MAGADQFIIRPFRDGDRAPVIELWSRVFANDPPWNEPGGMIDRKLTVQPELFLIGEVDGGLAATVLAGFDGVRGWIYHLAVEPQYRRRGFGTSMVRAVEEGLKRLGCPKINLQVRARNSEVVAFYLSLGYRIEDHTSMGKRI
jgi:ribosomal protein S18 acetylase RimI-like enzyme